MYLYYYNLVIYRYCTVVRSRKTEVWNCTSARCSSTYSFKKKWAVQRAWPRKWLSIQGKETHSQYFQESLDNPEKFHGFHDENRKRNECFSLIGMPNNINWIWTQAYKQQKDNYWQIKTCEYAFNDAAIFKAALQESVGKNHLLRWEIF